MFLVLLSLDNVLAPCCLCAGASDGHERSSTRLAWPSVATRNGLAPAHAQRRAWDGCLFCRRLPSVSRFAANSHGRSNAPRLVLMQIPQQPVPQINLLAAFGHFHQPDFLTAERLADETQAPLPPDLPTASDAPHRPRSLIDPWRFHLPIDPLGAPIQALRRHLSQGLVRSLPVELSHPGVKTLLLRCRAVSRWSGRFGFQRAMHPLVPAILLRPTRRNVLHLDAQPQPPHTQGRQPTRPRRAKRRSVVHPNDFRFAIPFEPPLKTDAYLLVCRPGHYLAAQHATAKPIAYRQRIAALPVARPKPTLEVHPPHVVWPRCHRQLRPHLQRPVPPPPPGLYQSVAHQDSAQRAHRRHPHQPIFLCQFGPQFLGSPMWMTHSQPHRSTRPPPRTLMRARVRTAAALVDPFHPLCTKTTPPFIPRLPANLMPPTQTGKTEHRRFDA